MSVEMDSEQRQMEAELKSLRLAQVPAGLGERLLTARRLAVGANTSAPFRPQLRVGLLRWWRWVLPAAGAAALMLLVASPWRTRQPDSAPAPGEPTEQSNHSQAPALPTALAADTPEEMDIDRQLVSAFDAIAELPTGEPVRVHCRQWSDTMVFRDPERGITVERSTPRLEIIPVRFETY
jgi:hypothetical protein